MENQTPLKTKFGYEVTWTKTEKYEAKFIVFEVALSLYFWNWAQPAMPCEGI